MYETPQLIDLGTFEAQTGLLQSSGNDGMTTPSSPHRVPQVR